MTLQFLYRVFRFPLALLILGCVPVVSWFFWSGHGGFGWILLPFCFPYILVRLWTALQRLPRGERKRGAKIAAGAVLSYMLVAYPLTRYTEYYITSTIGVPIARGLLFKLATFPIGLALPPYHYSDEPNRH